MNKEECLALGPAATWRDDLNKCLPDRFAHPVDLCIYLNRGADTLNDYWYCPWSSAEPSRSPPGLQFENDCIVAGGSSAMWEGRRMCDFSDRIAPNPYPMNPSQDDDTGNINIAAPQTPAPTSPTAPPASSKVVPLLLGVGAGVLLWWVIRR